MESLYELLKKDLTQKELKQNIGKFVFLKDDEIKKILEDEDINWEYKTFIAESCFNRINKLPFHLFILAISYVEDSNIFKKAYSKRINEMNDQELVHLIYNGNCAPECIVEIINTNSFNNHLKKEIKEKQSFDLQCALMLEKLYLYGNHIESLNMLGKEIVSIIQSSKTYTDSISMLIIDYLDYVIKNSTSLTLDSPAIQYSIEIIKDCLKKDIVLTPKMTEFYILYRVKELKLEKYVEQIIVSTENNKGKEAAYYLPITKTIKIFYNSFIEKYKKAFEQNLQKQNISSSKLQDSFAFLVNTTLIQSISHELSHVIDMKRINLLKDEKQNDFCIQFINNYRLRMTDAELYKKHHNNFTNENRADLFSIIDFSNQTNKLLNGAFLKRRLESISSINAEKIVEFYTEKTDKGLHMISPIEKFIRFYNQEGKNLDEITLKETDTQSILANLLSGYPIPIEVLREIHKIATGEIVTDNLHLEILRIINEYNESKTLEISEKKAKIS